MSRARDRRRTWSTPSRAVRAPSCRCRTAATIAAPSASSPTAAAIRARCRWARWSSRSSGSPATAMREVVLTGVDLTSYGADLPGSAEARPAGQDDPAPGARAEAAAPVVHRLDRGRRRTDGGDRHRTAADAASASLAAVGRRHDPEADEAPPSPRRFDPFLRRTCASFARISCSAPTSSPVFRPKPRRCSRIRCASSRNAA